jgi:hypothetical protein
MKLPLPPKLAVLLEETLAKQLPDSTPLMEKVRNGSLSDEEARAIIDSVSNEFCASGLGSKDEPNERGLLLEALLDWVNPATSIYKKR